MSTNEQIARENFRNGYNCAQSVFLTYADKFGFNKETALKLSSSFGGGMGRMREVCGTCSAMFMVAGILYGYTSKNDINEKAEHYRRIQHLAEEFKKRHETINCLELLKRLNVTKDPMPEQRTEQYYKVRPCIKFVRSAAEILDEYISLNQDLLK